MNQGGAGLGEDRLRSCHMPPNFWVVLVECGAGPETGASSARLMPLSYSTLGHKSNWVIEVAD